MEESARQLFERLGHRAMQHVIDEIVLAVRSGDDVRVTRLDRKLRELERLTCQTNAEERRSDADRHAAHDRHVILADGPD